MDTWLQGGGFMKTDIDRLHAVISAGIMTHLWQRGCGKTFARIHSLASSIELGDQNIICVISEYHDLMYLRPMMRSIFHERGICSINWKSPYQLICNDTNIFFVPSHEYRRFIRGRGDYTEIPMRHMD